MRPKGEVKTVEISRRHHRMLVALCGGGKKGRAKKRGYRAQVEAWIEAAYAREFAG